MKLLISESYVKLSTDEGYRVITAKVHNVLEGEYSKKTITVCGYLPQLTKREEITITGVLTQHFKYGENFEVHSYERHMPKSKDQIINFLSSSMFKGIGKKIATAIYEQLGKNAIEKVGKQGVSILEEINISDEKKELIVDVIQQNFLLNDVLKHYERYGIKAETVIKLYQLEKDSAVLISNPYLFARHNLLSYEFCDSMAFDNGMMPHNFNRIETAIFLLLKEEVRKGHCYMYEEMLVEKVMYRLNRSTSFENHVNLTSVLSALLTSRVCMAEHGLIYPTYLYYAEKDLASKITRMINRNVLLDNSHRINQILTDIQSTATDEQQLAVHTFINNQIMILTGDAGTGKTFTIDLMLQTALALNSEVKIALAAPTGRAAKRIMESLSIECDASTLHRLLGYGRNGKDDKPYYNEENPLPYDIVIADEFSMADTVLAKNLVLALKEGATLCIGGDPDQLESVGAGSVLKELLATNIPHVHLTKVFRQGADSKIIESGHKIKQGEMIDLKNHPTQYFIETPTPNIKAYVVASIKKLLSKGESIHDIMVLSPMRAGQAGFIELNETIRELVNPKQRTKRELSFGDIKFREGDKVMYLVNTPEQNIFNGDIGIVKSINTIDMELVVDFEGNVVSFPRKAMANMILAYASSIHKAQGNQAKIVITIVSDEHMVMLKRNLIYTGLSRAEQVNIIIGQAVSVEHAINTIDATLRRTNLANFINNKTRTVNKSSLQSASNY